MANEKGNFRLPYYEKCGFRSEEKKSLETILKDKPLDKAKLQKFCAGFTVPSTYRNMVWKLLLDVIPVFPDSHEFVMEQRNQEYKELVRALQTMRLIDSYTTKTHLYHAVWLLQAGSLNNDCSIPPQDEQFIQLAHVFLQYFDNDTDIYWLTKCFYDYINKYRGEFPRLILRFWALFEREDQELCKHMISVRLNKSLPLEKWFSICFADILNVNALAKIWDKICGGSLKILVYVSVVLLTTQRNDILKCTTLPTVLDCLRNISEEGAELIACKSIELWQKHGSPKNANANV